MDVKGERVRAPVVRAKVRRGREACALRAINSALAQHAGNRGRINSSIRSLCNRLEGRVVTIREKGEQGGWVETETTLTRGQGNNAGFMRLLKRVKVPLQWKVSHDQTALIRESAEKARAFHF